ncbi:MAG: hypothetical protein K1X70_19395 [Leptospirales bacterium]|nr:hypothetical protein [Leptospirales bacterium]HNN76758.1 hypothetical protein [Leptospiraceae bacterium]
MEKLNLVLRFDRKHIVERPYGIKENEQKAEGYKNGFRNPVSFVEAACDDPGNDKTYFFELEEGVSFQGFREFTARLDEAELGSCVTLAIREIPKGKGFNYGFTSTVEPTERPSERSLTLFGIPG